MQLHELKIKHEYLEDVANGVKTFELRKNDRNYQVGDLIRFIDVREEGKTQLEPDDLIKIIMGKKTRIDPNDLYRINYILKDVPEYGLDKDYCILGIKKLVIENK